MRRTRTVRVPARRRSRRTRFQKFAMPGHARGTRAMRRDCDGERDSADGPARPPTDERNRKTMDKKRYSKLVLTLPVAAHAQAGVGTEAAKGGNATFLTTDGARKLGGAIGVGLVIMGGAAGIG